MCENFGYELSEEVNDVTGIPLCQNSTGHVYQLYQVGLVNIFNKMKIVYQNLNLGFADYH